MDNDNDIEKYYERRLNELKTSDYRSSSVESNEGSTSVVNTAVDAAKSVASEKIKQIIIKYVLPVVLYVLGIFFLIMLVYVIIISIGCSIIPGAKLFSNECKNVNMTSDEINDIKSYNDINNAANDICSDSGGAYDDKNNNCSGY